MSGPFQEVPPLPDKYSEADKLLGFRPKYIVAVAGVTFQNPDGTPRSVHIAKAAELFDRYGTISVGLKQEPHNPYDSKAVAVYLSTDVLADVLKQVGYLPVRYCPSCGHHWGGKQKDSATCPQCGVTPTDPFSRFSSSIFDLMTSAGLPETGSTDTIKFGATRVWSDGEKFSVHIGILV